MDGKTIKIMEWNINMRSDKNAEFASFIKSYANKYDIFIFTEIVMNESVKEFKKQMTEYNFYESFNETGNIILMGIKKLIVVTKVITEIPNVSAVYCPNFLHVEIMIDSKKYNIIGTRIRIKSSSNKSTSNKANFLNFLIKHDEDNDYIDRRIQAIHLANYISNMENVIVAGDFNTSLIRGNMNKPYSQQKKEYEKLKYDVEKNSYYYLSTRFYNYQMFKEIIGKDFIVQTPVQKDKFSWGLKYIKIDNKFQYGYIKDDHLITSSDLIVKNTDYDWSFVNNNSSNYKNKSIPTGIPDHAILSADICIGGNEFPPEEYLKQEEYLKYKDNYPNAYECPECDRIVKNEQNYFVPEMCDECYRKSDKQID